ncbi:hypothetical protein EGR_08803 [Echinococcus granulosus]|uniref:Uncharacterized protein n=1 Tax=Echinococcus granulosus TaxID=6210 RepID=W6U583_ECHGR|nr:hypothetical protein EGR_08803 [Echinococcus granulosus]EUB56328.1 hypothetical protein EGR_08803 [Echinococcus granulosus]
MFPFGKDDQNVPSRTKALILQCGRGTRDRSKDVLREKEFGGIWPRLHLISLTPFSTSYLPK